MKIILFFQYPLLIDWVSECLLFNANSAFCQLYYGENKLIINDQYAELDFNSTSSLKHAFYLRKWWQRYKFIVLAHELTYFVKQETKGKKCYT
jgi:hypothetical protein